MTSDKFEQIIDEKLLPNGASLRTASKEHSLLIVFLRHNGCTFCRETLAKLQSHRSEIEATGTRIVLVNMSNAEQARDLFSKYGLADAWSIQDPEKRLYGAFGLQRGSYWQLLGPRSWIRGILHGAFFKHGVGKIIGDEFQLPGTFLLRDGKIVHSHAPRNAADEALFDHSQMCAL